MHAAAWLPTTIHLRLSTVTGVSPNDPFVQAAGLLYFNAHDIGVCEGIKELWAL